jgi:hypothetical protein
MRIGFVSGDVFEWRPDRHGVSVPDYAVQGHIAEGLAKRGHEVVVMTRVPGQEIPARPYRYAPGALPSELDLDLLFVDRLGSHGPEIMTAMEQVNDFEGPVVYHSYIAAPGWNPQFVNNDFELLDGKRWLILNRADDPRAAHRLMCGRLEQPPDGIEFAQWQPFFMLEHPWNGALSNKPTGMRRYRQGYYGRLPRSERRRSRQVEFYMQDRGWKRIIYGPPLSTRWLSKATGCVDGGRIPNRELPEHLESFDLTVQVPIDRFSGQGHVGYRTHRLIECTLAGVLQLVDPQLGIKELRPWNVINGGELKRYAGMSVEEMEAIVSEQRELLLPRADPAKVWAELTGYLEGWK